MKDPLRSGIACSSTQVYNHLEIRGSDYSERDGVQ